MLRPAQPGVISRERLSEIAVRPALLLSFLLLPLALRPAAADGFTPAQRAEIVAIMRDALRTDPTILRDAVVAMQQAEAQGQERESAAALARVGPRLHDKADPVEGNPNGDVTVVEFFDTRCPYCKRMLPVIAELVRRDPRVRVELKDMPILGPASLLESRALLAAQRQGGYLKMRDAIMGPGGNAPPTAESLRATAERLGLDGARLLRDMEDPAIQARLTATVALGQEIGIQGTPAMVIGQTLLAGATDVGELQAAIAAARAQR